MSTFSAARWRALLWVARSRVAENIMVTLNNAVILLFSTGSLIFIPAVIVGTSLYWETWTPIIITIVVYLWSFAFTYMLAIIKDNCETTYRKQIDYLNESLPHLTRSSLRSWVKVPLARERKVLLIKAGYTPANARTRATKVLTEEDLAIMVSLIPKS